MTKNETSAAVYEVGELFCGVGGLSRGFHEQGFTPRFANDIWPLAVHNFMMNFDRKYARSGGKEWGILGLPKSVEDVHAEEVLNKLPSSKSSGPVAHGELDVLLGGPPCQGFSVNSHTRSATDPRNFLFRHYVRILEGVAPKIFVLENVPGMLSLEGGKFFDELISEIGRLNSHQYGGYEIRFKILNAAHYGVPQERFRIVVVGTRRDVVDKVGNVELPEPKHYSLASAHFKGGRAHTFHYAIGHAKSHSEANAALCPIDLLRPLTVSDAINDLPRLENGGGQENGLPYGKSVNLTDFQSCMRSGSKMVLNHWARALFPPNTERVKYIPEGGDWRNIPHALLPPGMQRALRKDHTTRYGRLSRVQLAGTLLTKPDPHWGAFIHYDTSQQRLISVREAARLQSFPDVHAFFGGQVDQYRLCGNAVPPMLAEAVAVNVKRTLDQFYAQVKNSPRRERAAPKIGA